MLVTHGGFAIDINNDGWIDIVSLDEKENGRFISSKKY